MWSEEEKREISKYELQMAIIKCPGCSSNEKKWHRENSKGIPIASRTKYCHVCGHALE